MHTLTIPAPDSNARNDHFIGMSYPDPNYLRNEVLRIAVHYGRADESKFRQAFQNRIELFQDRYQGCRCLLRTHAPTNFRNCQCAQSGHEAFPFLQPDNACALSYTRHVNQHRRHGEGANSIRIGNHDPGSGPILHTVKKSKDPLQSTYTRYTRLLRVERLGRIGTSLEAELQINF